MGTSSNIDIKLTAKNETDAAFNAARNSIAQFGHKAQGTGQNINQMRTSVSQAGAAAEALRGILSGNIQMLDNLGTSAAGISPKFAGVATKLGAIGVAAGAAALVMSKLNNEFNIINNVKAAVAGEEIDQIRSDKDQAEKQLADMREQIDLEKARRAKISQTRVSDISAMDVGAETKSALMAREQARRDEELAAEEVDKATMRVYEARTKLELAKREAGRFASIDQQAEINKANDELARALEAAADAKEIAAMSSKIIANNVQRAAVDAQKAAESLADQKFKGEIELEVAVNEQTIARAQKYIDTITAGLDATNDPRLRALADGVGNVGGLRQAAMGGDQQAAARLREEQIKLNGLDKLVEMERNRTSPETRRKERSEERERRKIENRLRIAQESAERGGPLMKWQTEIIAANQALKTRANEEIMKAAAEEAKQNAHRVALERNGQAAANSLDIIKRNLSTLLQAAGG